MSKQLLQSQAHLRHMEQRASNLEKLKASYEVHLKMRDGIENMFEAYKKTPGKNQGRNLASIKAGWKECVQTLCLIEAQTEALLGTFRFQIESKTNKSLIITAAIWSNFLVRFKNWSVLHVYVLVTSTKYR